MGKFIIETDMLPKQTDDKLIHEPEAWPCFPLYKAHIFAEQTAVGPLIISRIGLRLVEELEDPGTAGPENDGAQQADAD